MPNSFTEKEAATNPPVAKIKGVEQLSEEANNATAISHGTGPVYHAAKKTYRYTPPSKAEAGTIFGVPLYHTESKPVFGGGKGSMIQKGHSDAPSRGNPQSIPRMHNGGPVLSDGAYQLKAGEHVLTAAEAAKAKKHAIMAAGIKSLVKPGKGSK
jgi:hypothetical protein